MGQQRSSGGIGYMISFVILPKNETENILPSLFRILHSNMSVIAPTGNSYDEDYRFWHNSVAPALEKDARQIILIYDDAEIIGYFQYYVNATTFMMEEIQFRKNTTEQDCSNSYTLIYLKLSRRKRFMWRRMHISKIKNRKAY